MAGNDNKTGKKDGGKPDQSSQPRTMYPLLAIQALKRQGGRPPYKFRDSQEVIDKAVEYFERAVETGESITITGLAAWLGTTRKTLWDYDAGNHADPVVDIISAEGDSDGVCNAIKRVKHIAESFAEGHGFVYLLFLSPIAQKVWGAFLIAGLIFAMVWNLIYNTTFYDGPIVWR